MKNLANILAAHAARYPLMEPQDAVKLLYQHEFGPGHMIEDPDRALLRLQDECAALTYSPSVPPFEDIGNGLVRVMLAAWHRDEYPPEQLNQDFIRSAASHVGSQASFLEKLDLLRELTRSGSFSFSSEVLEQYLADYIALGCPAVSHSETYRSAYHPAYRVVRRTCLSLAPAAVILKEINRLSASGRPLLIAIDGRCASGKTTLAAQLQAACSCSVIHMDDFFLRPSQRTKARYETPGENIDHERFLAEVLQPLHTGHTAEFCPFDCSTQAFSAPVRVEPTPIVIVEGSYSCHPNLWPYYDLKVFLTLPPEVQMARIVARDGADYAEVFRSKWIPLEEQYFQTYQLEDRCDLSFVCGSADPESTDN